MVLIKTENLTHTYMKDSPFEAEALKGIDLTVNQGEFIGLIGPTGSGKSTLIQHFNGLLRPSSGSISVLGMDLSSKGVDFKKVREDIGLLFQYPEHQLFEETIYADIAFGPKNMGLTPKEVEERVEDALKLVGLSVSEAKERSPFSLSGGQMRKVALAGVLAMRPKVLILDEPTAGMDPSSKAEILNRINILNKEHGITIIMVSHSMEEVAQIAKRVVVLYEGKIAADETIEQIFSLKNFIQNLGLDLPAYTKLAYKLHDEGIPVNTSVYTLNGIEEELIKQWNF
ncbi:MAG: energy-coupling factor transporter ATPase [Armatimonadota bacterium]